MHYSTLRSGFVALVCGLTSLSFLFTDARAQVIADSIAEFSGVQGQDGWNYGYRNLTADGGTRDSYDAVSDFIAFAGGDGMGPWDGSSQFWTGTVWDLQTAAAGPWTFLAAEGIHPNGTNSAPNEEHWAIRRWTAPAADLDGGSTLVEIQWSASASNPNGTGTTAQLHINGALEEAVAIAGNDTTGFTRSTFITIEAGDIIDLALTPVGPGGDEGDGADGSNTSMIITKQTDSDEDGLPDSWEESFFPGDLTQLMTGGDKDGDGVNDEEEWMGGTNPTKADSDGDGFSDGEEIDNGSNPNDLADIPLSLVLADSRSQFSGVQGQDGWNWGYRDYTASGETTDYDAANDFIPFLNDGSNTPETDPVEVNHWNGSAFDFEGNPPWTFLADEGTHPNGPNNGDEHWTVRRWTASGLGGATPVRLTWHTRATNPGGDGVTGSIHLNGAQIDSVTIAGNDTAGFVRTIYLELEDGDIVDQVLTPEGLSNRSDGSDGSANWMRIDDRLPDCPLQPDGTVFIPANAPDTDEDGLPDVYEKCFAGDLDKLASGQDFDNDGLNDEEELAAGTDPTNPDADGDGLLDGDELTSGTDPANPDSDGDGFNDGDEVSSGHSATDPNENPLTTAIAHSENDWPADGETNPQGVNGWTYGYYNTTVNGEPDAVDDFIAFPTDGSTTPSAGNYWDGARFDWFDGNPPWTEITQSAGHPNGDNNVDVHWATRRWEVDTAQPTALAVYYHLHKNNTNGGNGTSAVLLQNGQPLDSITVAFNDGTGLTSRYFLDAQPGDQIEIALTPRGTDGGDSDGSDSSSFWMAINPALPANPTQPDGTPFLSAIDNDGDGLPDQWERENFGNLDQGANDDPNGNGFDNLADFALGFDPANPGPDGTLTIDGTDLTELGVPRTDVQPIPNGVDFCLLYTRRSDYEALGLVITVEFSPDMTEGSWVASADPGTVVATAAGLEVVKVDYPFFLPNGRKAQFWRMVVEIP